MRNYFVLAAFFLLAGCSKSNYAKYAPIYEKESLSNIPDFSNLAYWAAHPNKKNPSDSIPKRFQKQAYDTKDVDVFFVLVSAVRARWHAPNGKGLVAGVGGVTFGVVVIIAMIAD